MKHFQILKRSWDILWSYKVLWIFGIILALTTASASSSGSQGGGAAGGGGSSYFLPSQADVAQGVETLRGGLARARQSIESGAALAKLDHLVQYSQSLANPLS